MLCPKCGYTMSVKKEDTSTGSGKTYDRIQYICNGDDVWITIETPQEVEEETDETEK